jgi:hypothetical protein
VRALLGLALFALIAPGCDGSDISDDPPITSTQTDAGGDIADAAGGDVADASEGSRAQIFCDRYDDLCMYDDADAMRFDNEAACLAAFEDFTPARQECVEGELDQFEANSMAIHCNRANGTGTCSN